jgi:cystathionine beta-lyase/cystathionine gamma-synthase
MAALTSIFLTVLSPGKTIIIPDDLYHGTRTICGNLMKQWQVTTVAIDMSNMDDVKR